MSDSSTPRLFWWVVLASLALALVPTVWPALDLQAAAYFFGTPPRIESRNWWWIESINFYIPAVFRSILGLCAVLWIICSANRKWHAWRLPLAFVVVAGVMGPGIVVNWGFKDNWQRARPYQVENFGGTQKFTRAAEPTDQCDNNCSFVSGHVACGFFLTSLMLVLRKRRVVWACCGTLAGLVIGFARMSDVAHWLSDVLWACPITLITSWLCWKMLLLLQRHHKPSITVG